jgi:hypothetical protein
LFREKPNDRNREGFGIGDVWDEPRPALGFASLSANLQEHFDATVGPVLRAPPE